jgi:YD repeat-containing protein
MDRVIDRVRNTVALALLAAASAFLPIRIEAQSLPLGDDISRPIAGVGHDYIHALAETVNPANGTVNLKINLPVPKARGFTLGYAVTYNSGEVHHFSSGSPGCGGLDTTSCSFLTTSDRTYDGWGDTLPYSIIAVVQAPLPPYSGQYAYCNISLSYNFYDAEGNGHVLGLAAISSVEGSGSGNYETPFACQSAGYNPTSCFSTQQSGFYGCNSTSTYTPSASGGDSQVSAKTDLCTGNPNNSPGECGNGTPPFYVTDTSGTVYSFGVGGNEGQIQFPTIEDRNGNITTIAGAPDSTAPIIVTDSLGRQVISIAQYGFKTTGYTVGGLTYTPTYTTTTANFTAGSLQVNPPPQGVSCTAHFTANDSALPVIQSLQLPNHKAYTFKYDPEWGLLSEVDYPDGGWVRYTYKLSDTRSTAASFSGYFSANPGTPPIVGACNYQYQTPVVQTRQVGYAPGSSAALSQTFTYSTVWDATNPLTWDSKTTTVLTVDNVTGRSTTTTYGYSPISQAVQPDTVGQLDPELPVESLISRTDWNGKQIQTDTETWFDQFMQYSDTTTIPGGLSKETVYDHVFTFPGYLLEEDDYGFGTTPTLYRKKLWSYYEYQFPNQIITEDASGHQLAESDIYYDGQTSIGAAASAMPVAVPVSNLPQYQYPYGASSTIYTHDETKYGPSSVLPRANATTVITKLSGGTSPSTAYTYDETGQVISREDPNDHTTTYAYTDEYTDQNPPGGYATNAYVTSITYPSTTTALVEQFAYRYQDGQLSGYTDENNQKTIYEYADPLNRLTGIEFPDSGGKTLSYDDDEVSLVSPSVTTTTLLGSSNASSSGGSMIARSVRDGMGHVVHLQVLSGPDEPAMTDFTYDGMGEVSSQSTPYRTKGEPTYGVASFSYDSLGRKVQEVETDGVTVLSWCYNSVASLPVGKNAAPYCSSGNLSSEQAGSWMDATDGNGKHKQTVGDAFGRTVSIMEPDANNTEGIETDYHYSVLNDLVRVDQWGGPNGSSGDRFRTFMYDSVSRLITSFNQETGTVCYGQVQGVNCVGGYDGNGNLLYKTDARGFVTAYTYDALNRLTSKSYPTDTSTPTSCYQYDTSAVAGAGANLIGRMANEWTQSTSLGACAAALPSSGVLTRRSILAYDPMGRVSSEQQCTPTNCSEGAPYSVLHDYDLAGNPTTYTNGIGSITLTNAYDAADHLLSVTSSWDDATHPSPLFSAPTYYAGGQLNTATYGTGLTLMRTYNNQLWQTGETATGGIVVNPIAGSAALTITGAEQTK